MRRNAPEPEKPRRTACATTGAGEEASQAARISHPRRPPRSRNRKCGSRGREGGRGRFVCGSAALRFGVWSLVFGVSIPGFLWSMLVGISSFRILSGLFAITAASTGRVRIDLPRELVGRPGNQFPTSSRSVHRFLFHPSTRRRSLVSPLRLHRRWTGRHTFRQG